MSTQTVLVIDDSATIRKMVDSHLTQHGYRVVLAPTAEKGLELAPRLQPDIILLDHQLPGTTGIEVCRKIIAMPECRTIPFVISSTLRKQAYVEYMDVPNVVDSLPKPFRPELLKTTIENALEVGAMIVSSQADGTAVPEVVGEVADASLSGAFDWVTPRELLDFLNNGHKTGALEIELEHDRIWFYLEGGRIQSVVSASVTPDAVAQTLPEALTELAPLLRFTMSSGFNSQVDGLVELLDRKVLDPRMLRTLLKHQAAHLTWHCFGEKPKSFNFYSDRQSPALFRRSPLEISLTGLLIEAALNPHQYVPEELPHNVGWMRRALRGQNLDRSGLNARQIQLLTHLGQEPVTLKDLADKVNLSTDEIRRSLDGFCVADWVETQVVAAGRNMIALEPDPVGSSVLREILMNSECAWTGKVVRDEFGLQLLLNRQTPDVLLVSIDGGDQLRLPACIEGRLDELLETCEICLICDSEVKTSDFPDGISRFPVIRRPYSSANILVTLGELATREFVNLAETGRSQNSDKVEKLLALGAE